MRDGEPAGLQSSLDSPCRHAPPAHVAQHALLAIYSSSSSLLTVVRRASLLLTLCWSSLLRFRAFLSMSR